MSSETRKPPLHFMSFAPSDYFSSPRVNQLLHDGNTDAVLAYLHFMFSQFINQGPIRDVNAAGAFRLPGKDAAKLLETLTAGGDDALIKSKDGHLWNERVRLDLIEAMSFKQSRTEAGRKGATARWKQTTLLAKSIDEFNDIASVATRYIDAFNAAHGKRHTVTPLILKCLEAALTSKPPYIADALIASAIMSCSDEWYSDREPSYPLRFRRAGNTEGKSHLDDLLAKIGPGVKFPKRIVELVKQFAVVDYFKERTKR